MTVLGPACKWMRWRRYWTCNFLTHSGMTLWTSFNRSKALLAILSGPFAFFSWNTSTSSSSAFVPKPATGPPTSTWWPPAMLTRWWNASTVWKASVRPRRNTTSSVFSWLCHAWMSTRNIRTGIPPVVECDVSERWDVLEQKSNPVELHNFNTEYFSCETNDYRCFLLPSAQLHKILEPYLRLDSRLRTENQVAKDDRLVQLLIKGLLYEACVEFCQAKATYQDPELRIPNPLESEYCGVQRFTNKLFWCNFR